MKRLIPFLGKKELAIIGLFVLVILPVAFTQVQAARPSTQTIVTMTSPDPIGANYDYDIMGGKYGSNVAAGGGYFFVAEQGNIYVYNERNRLIKTMEGSSVATGGGYLAIGNPGYWAEGASSSGKVDIYSLSNLRQIVATITQPNDLYYNFGSSIAISSNQLLVSDSGTNLGENAHTGDVYVYSVPSFTYETTLVQQNPEYAPGAPFGYEVAFCGDHIVVSAPLETVNGHHSSGRVYVYSSTTYALETTISNPDAFDPYVLPGGYFGWSIATVGENIWISEPNYAYPTAENPDGTYGAGIAYCYSTDGTQIATLESENPTLEGYFGKSIAASNDYVIVGAPGESVDVIDDTGTVTVYSAGKAYIFGSSGSYVKTLISLNPETDGSFGQSVAIGSNYLVGAPKEDVTLRYRSTISTYIDAGHAYKLS